MKKIIAATSLALAALPILAETPVGPETWHYFGEGRLRDDLVTTYWYVSNHEFPVDIYESDQVPGRYKFIDAYKNYPMASSAALLDHEHSFVVDAEDPDHVWIEKGCIGLNYNEAQADGWEFVIWSVAENEYNNVYGDWEGVEENVGRCWGTLSEGCITFPKNNLLVHYYQPPSEDDPDGPWTLPNDGFRLSNSNGMFRIMMPGAKDYDIQLDKFEERHEADGSITLRFGIKAGADVAYVLYGTEKTEDPTRLLANLDAGNGTRLDLNPDFTGWTTFEIPYTEDGKFILAALPFASDDTARTPATIEYTCEFDETEWKKFGNAQYTEAILCSSEFSEYYPEYFHEQTYEVAFEANRLNPGMVRLVNPYGEPYYWANNQTYDHTTNYYLDIDCTDPNRVQILRTKQGIGLDLNLSTIYIWSRANRELTEKNTPVAEIDKMDVWGRFDPATREITFPNDALLNYFELASMNLYRANRNGRFKIVVPEEAVELMTSGVHSTLAEDEGEAWFNLQGIRVERPAEPGLYILRSGSTTRKVLVP